MNTKYSQFIFDDCLVSPVNGVQYKKLNNRNIQTFGFDSIEDLHNQYPDFPLICNRLKTTYISVSNKSNIKAPNVSFLKQTDINIDEFVFYDKLISPITGYSTRKINVQNIEKFGFNSVEELNELWPDFPLVCQELDDIYKEKQQQKRKEYDLNPKKCKILSCTNKLSYEQVKAGNQFCSSSCGATHNNMKRNQTRIQSFCSVCGKPSRYEGYVHVPCQRKKEKSSIIKLPINKEKGKRIYIKKSIPKHMNETILSILGRAYNDEADIIELKEKLHHLMHVDLMTPKQIKDKYKLPYSHMFSFLSRTMGIKMRSVEEAQELIRTQNNDLKTEKRIYYEKCRFLFDIYTLPDLKGFDLLSKYKLMPRNPKNRIDEHYVHRDHMVSRDYGWLNNIPPEHIAHPANCEILLDINNIKKGNDCSITYDELLLRIKEWNEENTLNATRVKHSINRKEHMRQKNIGKKTYNDGIKNHIVFAGDTPEPHWVLGMIKKNQK